MSGKPPPTGPRALSGAGPSNSATASTSSLNGPGTAQTQRPPSVPQGPKRIPTGPRSLNAATRFGPPLAKNSYNGYSSGSYANSAGPSMSNAIQGRGSQDNRYLGSSNGKRSEIELLSVDTTARQPSSPQRQTQSKAWPDPTTTTTNGITPTSSIPESRASISIPIPSSSSALAALPTNRPSVQISLPSSSHKAAPPPPPNEPPPPPPPPSQPPPPPAPPPPEPPSSQPPPPPPPPSARPPSPPKDELPPPPPPPQPIGRPPSPPRLKTPPPPSIPAPFPPPPPPPSSRPPVPPSEPPVAGPSRPPPQSPIRSAHYSPIRSRPLDLPNLPAKPITIERPISRAHSPLRATSSRRPRSRSRSRPPLGSSSRPRSRSPRSWSSRSPSPGRYYDRRRSRFSPPRRDWEWERDRDFPRRSYRSPPRHARGDFPPPGRLPPRPLSPYGRRERDREPLRMPSRPRSPEKEPELPTVEPSQQQEVPPPAPPVEEVPKRPSTPVQLELPSWPPPESECSHERTFKVLFDPSTDANYNPVSYLKDYNHTPSHYRDIIQNIKYYGEEQMKAERIQAKGKGKEVLLRYGGATLPNGPNGEVREQPAAPTDPRKLDGYQAIRSRGANCHREDLAVVTYDYDENSHGPSPATGVLLANLSPLTNNANLKRHLTQYGHILGFESKIDPENGTALGLVHVRFASHAEAKHCVEKEHGRRGGLTNMMPLEEWYVVFDGEGKVVETCMKYLEEKKREERNRKYRPAINGHASLPPKPSGSHTPQTPSIHTPIHLLGPSHASTPIDRPRPGIYDSRAGYRSDPFRKPVPAAIPDALRKAREEAQRRPTEEKARVADHPATPAASSIGKPGGPMLAGPSSTAAPEPKKTVVPEKTEEEKAAERERVMKDLVSLGKDYIHVQFPSHVDPCSIKESKIRPFFDPFGLTPDKVFRNYAGLYVTFIKPGSAIRASVLLASAPLAGSRVQLHYHASPKPPVDESGALSDAQVVLDVAKEMILNEIKALLEREVNEKYVNADVKRVMMEEKTQATKNEHAASGIPKPTRGLKGLSFKKEKKKVEMVEKVHKPVEPVKKKVEDKANMDEEEVDHRPRKKQRKEVKKSRIIDDEDLESEEETTPGHPAIEEASRKRATSELVDEEGEQPVKKKAKLDTEARGKKKKGKRAAVEVVHADVEPPAVAKIIVQPDRETPSRSASPSTGRLPRAVTPPPTPPPNPIELGLCEDEEDLYFAKLALAGYEPSAAAAEEEDQDTTSEPTSYRKHVTGSARTEGFYKIDHKDKAAYVAQYQKTKTSDVNPVPVPVDEPQLQHITSSRSNRANARRRAQGLEEINQVQRAVALSKGENAAAELTFKFNQLQTRKKHLRFSRSPIHDWGLYAMEKISKGEMVIEYVGEVIRAQVAEKREKVYERQGIGSSYLFRIDEELVVDATKKGNLGRLINHSCDPNCTAKIITISGEKKIVIYAKQDIELGDEITYDYHFPFEQDKIPCLCGSAKCRGYLN